ncbi:MAG: PaREP1 family protein [Caldivirga sp.]|uniref:PaREP1 family protein n=1 Tax=Caldivirga sp. TaxID=2080243 RepID=UPI003D102D3E
MSGEVTIPSMLIEELRRRGLDPEDVVLNALINVIHLDPNIVIEARLELTVKYLNEGRVLIDKDPVQASEKLYKAAEEAVKALAQYYGLREILNEVNEKGRWTVTELEKAMVEISKRLGDWFGEAWDRAWALHVWGFHEAKFDAEDVRIRLPYIERIVEEANKVVKGLGQN